MNCDSVARILALYCYGELPPEEEDRVEDHLDGCATCRDELERQRSLMAALDRRETDVSGELLAECRSGLMTAIERNQAPARDSSRSQAWSSIRQGCASLLTGFWALRQPLGAVALVALGYFSAYFTGAARVPSGPDAGGGAPTIARVRSVRPGASGHVQIALDEVRARVVSGRMDDRNIQRLLLEAARDENNPGVRVESIDFLKDHAASAGVRAALLTAAAHDPNPGVRLKALEGLKRLPPDAEVRQTLAQVLLQDDNPGVRIQAIDMLMANRDDSMVGMLQNLVDKEDNSYVRLRCEKALKAMNASVGTF
jgi:anti-sigma factor RsiW